MTAFNFTALKSSGQEKKGIIEADSEKQVRQMLRAQQLIPVKVNSIKPKSNQKNLWFVRKISVNDLSLITRQLATLLEAGIPIEQSLQGVSEQVEKNVLKNILQGVRSKVLEGHSLAHALSLFPHAFSELYCATVAAGEQTGRLDSVLISLAEYTEKQHQMRQKIIQALIYPCVMIFVSVGIISFLLAFIVPKIIDVFSTTGQLLPPLTLVLIQVSHFLTRYGFLLALGLMLSILLFRYALHSLEFKKMWHRFLLKIPFLSYLIRSVNTARYARTFGILLHAGVNVLESMQVSASLITNLAMQQTIADSKIEVQEGKNISDSLKETQYFSPMSLHLIASGENSGKLPELLKRSADNLDTEVNRLIETLLTLFEPVIILIMGAVVLFIVLATLLPIFSMEQLV